MTSSKGNIFRVTGPLWGEFTGQLKKLSMYGIKHTELEWFSSYLDKRKQAVFCHNKLSSLVDLTTGVPQGSVLGPFLLSGVPDYFYRNKISSGGDLSHYSSASLY